MPRAADPQNVTRVVRAAAGGPRRQTIGGLAKRAGLSYGAAARAVREASAAGLLAMVERDIVGGSHLHWELTAAGGRYLGAEPPEAAARPRPQRPA